MAALRFAARDPGAAGVLAAVIGDPRLGVVPDVWALPRAAGVFARHGIACREFDENYDADGIRREWEASPASVLVTGTTHLRPFEPLLWDLARSRGARSLAIVDQWTNLTPRFAAGRPEAVAVIDEDQAAGLVDFGFRPEDVLVIGHPFLRAVAASEPHDQPAREAGDARTLRVLFVSESIASDVASGANPPYGFDEVDVFGVVLRAAGLIAARGTPVEILVRLHPYEDPAGFQARTNAFPCADGVRVVVSSRDQAARDCVRWSDLVAGISSMLLMEAIVMDRPVVSVQPGLVRANECLPAARGFIPVLTERQGAGERLADWFAEAGTGLRARDRQRAFVDLVAADRLTPLFGWIAGRACRVG